MTPSVVCLRSHSHKNNSLTQWINQSVASAATPTETLHSLAESISQLTQRLCSDFMSQSLTESISQSAALLYGDRNSGVVSQSVIIQSVCVVVVTNDERTNERTNERTAWNEWPTAEGTKERMNERTAAKFDDTTNRTTNHKPQQRRRR